MAYPFQLLNAIANLYPSIETVITFIGGVFVI